MVFFKLLIQRKDKLKDELLLGLKYQSDIYYFGKIENIVCIKKMKLLLCFQPI
jgi:hypothetical protein